ncbi:hypothetical protein BPOR_0547g00010 [Botrytis porri]|uniref:Uncharacterized protein n=1 Tax=Botrytis porri TaxID=87229 RepID=A0A4Z1KIP9_9HELO|nr:hypothetical protein BPOR_0547g00010 [Botrytis porri]
MTPWLAVSEGCVKTKNISTSPKTFHAALAGAILEGFNSLPAGGYDALEKVFKFLTTAVETRARTGDDVSQCIILIRHEYSPETKTIRTFIRIVTFQITQEMVEVQRKKSSSSALNVIISYNECEGKFNIKEWTQASGMIEESKKKKMEDYVKEDTIEIPL